MQALHTISRFASIAAAAFMLAAAPAYAQDAAPAAAPKPTADLLTFIDGDHTLGDENAPVKIIEYASLSCPHCMQSHIETFPKLKEQYIDTGKVVYIYRHFPFNEPALRGAMLAECSGDDFFKYLAVMFKTQDKWAFDSDPVSGLRNLAKVGGMSEADFDACMNNKEVQDRIVAGMTWGANQLGIQSTPTTFINGEKLNGFQTIEDLARHIEPALKKTAQ